MTPGLSGEKNPGSGVRQRNRAYMHPIMQKPSQTHKKICSSLSTGRPFGLSGIMQPISRAGHEIAASFPALANEA
jgi:hypothetical protein